MGKLLVPLIEECSQQCLLVRKLSHFLIRAMEVFMFASNNFCEHSLWEPTGFPHIVVIVLLFFFKELCLLLIVDVII